MPAVSSVKDITAPRTMESLEHPADFIAPYRLPSRHPSADGAERAAPRSNAHAGSAAPKPLPLAPDNASDIKRRQEALLIAYLVGRLAR